MKAFVPILFFAILALPGCTGAGSSKPSSHSTPPAEVLQISDEMELATVRLTAKAEERLGISVGSVKLQDIVKRRPYPGVVVVPPENQTVLLAPVAGTVHYNGPLPLAMGTAVSQGQSLFSLDPVQTKDDFALGPAQRDQLNTNRITVEQGAAALQGRIDVAKAELKAAKIEKERAVQLFDEKVGSRRRVDETTARVKMAEETLKAAEREKSTLRKVDRQPKAWSPTPLVQLAPISGTILRTLVSSGQSVSAGQPLLELVNLGRLWVRVRVPQGEAKDIQKSDDARLFTTDRQLQAEPVKGPPTADQTTSTVDLYYVVENSGSALTPDQRLEVSLPLKGSGQSLVVPTASILYDHHGGAWVYVRTEPLMYKRFRVLVDISTEDGYTVLVKGPELGSSVVVDGAAELFGVEFGND